MVNFSLVLNRFFKSSWLVRLKFLLFFVASRGRFFHVDVNAVFFSFNYFVLFFFFLSFLNAYG